MDGIIEDVKQKRYNTVEYPVGDDSSVKLVECLPASTEEDIERARVVTLDELNVLLALQHLILIVS